MYALVRIATTRRSYRVGMMLEIPHRRGTECERASPRTLLSPFWDRPLVVPRVS